MPLGGVDFDYGATFPHEANMDLLAGIDFKKGCFVGQEVVSRMKHRGLVRKRIAKYRAQGDAPGPGEAIRAGDVEIGVTGSRQDGEGLAMIRLDRLGDALAAGATPVAAGATCPSRSQAQRRLGRAAVARRRERAVTLAQLLFCELACRRRRIPARAESERDGGGDGDRGPGAQKLFADREEETGVVFLAAIRAARPHERDVVSLFLEIVFELDHPGPELAGGR